MTRRQIYFLKQKLVGVAIIILAIVATLLVGEATIGIVGILLGLGLVFTESRVFMADDYYYSRSYGSYRR